LLTQHVSKPLKLLFPPRPLALAYRVSARRSKH
jgi:hypothetical protein